MLAPSAPGFLYVCHRTTTRGGQQRAAFLLLLLLHTPLRPAPPRPGCAVYSYDDWKACNASEAEVKAAGKYHTKGKLYEVQDGDICFFKIGC